MSQLIIKESCDFTACSDISELVIESDLDVVCHYKFGASGSDIKVIVEGKNKRGKVKVGKKRMIVKNN